MKRDRQMFRVSMILLALALIASRAEGQTTKVDALIEKMTPVQQDMMMKVGGMVTGYWNEQFNRYKESIDRTLSPTDLAKLNQLRVRWNILLVQMLNREYDEGQDGEYQKFAEIDDEEFNGPDVVDIRELEHGEVESDFDDFDFEQIPTESDEVTTKRPEMEIMEIWLSTLAIATKYRPDLDRLRTRVVGDIGSFLEQVGVEMSQYVAENEAVLRNDKELNVLVEKRAEFRGQLEEAALWLQKGSNRFNEIYGMALEPVIMLFNGADLQSLLPFAANQTGGTSLGSVGELLPSTNLLQQNYPNPASTTTTIPFHLPQRSTGSILRLYGADGSLVRTVDLGPLSQGDGKQEINVADLPVGSYLYHLTVTFGEGEQVYSRVMEVVR